MNEFTLSIITISAIKMKITDFAQSKWNQIAHHKNKKRNLPRCELPKLLAGCHRVELVLFLWLYSLQRAWGTVSFDRERYMCSSIKWTNDSRLGVAVKYLQPTRPKYTHKGGITLTRDGSMDGICLIEHVLPLLSLPVHTITLPCITPAVLCEQCPISTSQWPSLSRL